MNLRTNDDLGFKSGSRPRNQETKRIDFVGFTQVALNESYKAKNSKNASNQTVPTTEADLLLERYGDIMGVVDNHPAFQMATKPLREGGWGLYPQALTNACKTQSEQGDISTGVAKVLQALRFTANYRAARNKASFFWAVLRNGNQKEA